MSSVVHPTTDMPVNDSFTPEAAVAITPAFETDYPDRIHQSSLRKPLTKSDSYPEIVANGLKSVGGQSTCFGLNAS
jgi:hypothetical protein